MAMTTLSGALARPLRRLTASLALLALLATLASPVAAVPDNFVQANLVFPRGSSKNFSQAQIYRPVYPFPIVMSLQNMDRAWGYNVTVDWVLYDLDEEDIIDDGTLVGMSGKPWDPHRVEMARDPHNETAEPEPDWFAIDYTKRLINTTSTKFQLKASFYLTDGCIRKEWEKGHVKANASEYYGYNRYVSFELSPDGKYPDIEVPGSCADAFGAIEIEERLKDGSLQCPLLGKPAQVDKCATRIGPAEAKKVADEMLAGASCTTGSWPDPTILNDCGLWSSAAGSSRQSWGSMCLGGLGVIFAVLIAY